MKSVFSKFAFRVWCLFFGLMAGWLMYLMNEYPGYGLELVCWSGAIVTMFFSLITGYWGWFSKN